MIPVVLSGGFSTRMGEDKGLKKWNGKPMALSILELFHKSFKQDAIIAIRPEQQSDYREVFPNSQFVLDDPALEIGGPLKGILSVHKLFPLEDLFIVACDMPLMSHDILEKIKSSHRLNTSKDILVCRYHDHIEPLCGIYTSKGLQKLQNKIDLGQLKNHRMTDVIASMDSLLIEITDEEYGSFLNLNSIEDEGA